VNPMIGVVSQLRDRQATLVEGRLEARTDDRNAWSSHRALTPLGRTRDFGLNMSPVCNTLM
jgi:hypothetical protein